MLDILSHDSDIVEIRLARPPVNALNLPLLDALRLALTKAAADGARGLVLSSAPGVFCAGVDVPELLTLDRQGVQAFWRGFFRTVGALVCSPVPVVAAIGGHSPAGGAVLALACDYRVMAEGPFRIGLNEVQVGLTLPECVLALLARLVGPHRAERLVVAGAMVESAEALACGMVDELTNAEQVVTRALHWLQGTLALPGHAMLATRATARAGLVATWARPDELPLDRFLETYEQPQTQAVLQALVARLKSRH